MKIRVLYFGGAKASVGLAEEWIELSSGACLSDAQLHVASLHEALGVHLSTCRWAIGEEFCADPGRTLRSGDVVAIIPPVQGGAPSATLVRDPIDEAKVLARIESASAGAIVSFVGKVRNHTRGRAVTAIEYEAYEPMARRALEAIAEQASDAGSDIQVTIEHRLGKLAVGEAAVVIGASSPHRDEAFARTRSVLEALKKDVPIWKHEHYDDGSSWVGWGGG